MAASGLELTLPPHPRALRPARDLLSLLLLLCTRPLCHVRVLGRPARAASARFFRVSVRKARASASASAGEPPDRWQTPEGLTPRDSRASPVRTDLARALASPVRTSVSSFAAFCRSPSAVRSALLGHARLSAPARLHQVNLRLAHRLHLGDAGRRGARVAEAIPDQV